MSAKPDLLYVSPVIPAITGNGLAMRAGMVLESLASYYSVSLLVLSLYLPFDEVVPEMFRVLCRRSVVVPAFPLLLPRRSFVPAWVAGLFRAGRRLRVAPVEKAYRDLPFEVVHLFRLSVLPFSRAFLKWGSHAPPKRHLDLDDIESKTHMGLAELYRLNGDPAAALFEESQAQRYEAWEAEVLRDFDRVYVCSEADRAKLGERARCELCVLPNGVHIPAQAEGLCHAASVEHRGKDGIFTLIFVGTLGYYPNEDAVLYFCTEILPRIRQRAPREFRVEILGTGAGERIRQAATTSGIRLVGEVPDVGPWYERADAVVVPIRAGGGTRIKVLEAFAFRCPVVSTSVGAEGIEARHDEHILIGDTPEDFADRCVQLMKDRACRERLAKSAFSLFARSYSADAIKRTIAGFSRSPAHRESPSTDV